MNNDNIISRKSEDKLNVDENVSDNFDRSNEKAMNHVEAMQFFKDSLAEIIIGDPFLNELHTSVTLEELNSLISLEHGQSITVNIKRADGTVLPIVIPHNSTVAGLKSAFQRHIVLTNIRENSHTTHISWKHVWKSYWFYFNKQKLIDNRKKLKDYGICNNDTLTFLKRLHER